MSSKAAENSTPTPRRTRSIGWWRFCHIVIPLLMIVWLSIDPLAIRSFDQILLVDDPNNPLERFTRGQNDVGSWRPFLILICGAIGFVLIGIDLSKAVSRKRPMTVGGLLMITAAIALWSSVLTQREQIAWAGKSLRWKPRLDHFETLASRLMRDWPTEDGSIEGLGPFTSYPFGRPTVLLLLTPYPLEDTDTVIAAISRSEDTLRFQLGGKDGGDWIEWHPVNQSPTSFTGGLSERRDLLQSSPLRPRWFLVRYQQ
ncbi:MAG: hypothetical protein AAF745_09180 [Planctomycetota bacterium]